MIKSSIVLLLLISSFASASNMIYYEQEILTDSELKKAVGKTILNQKDLMINQDYLYKEVNTLKRDLESLKKLLKDREDNHKLDSLSLRAMTIFSFTNIREEPHCDSKIVKIVPKETMLTIAKCEKNSKGSVWCKLQGENSHIRDFTIKIIDK